MKQIIINADDFGYTDGVSSGILELFERGCITSTSLMMASDGVTERLRKYSSALLRGRAGVHLQLTGGAPLSPRSECPDLHASGGSFRDPRLGPRPPAEQVESEWRRQIDAAVAVLGVAPSHLDSHHGMHRLPEYFETYLLLARELGVPVRGPVEPDMVNRMKASGVVGSTILVREWTGRGKGVEELERLLAAAVERSGVDDLVEVITHPGRVDEPLLAASSMAHTREIELDALLTLSDSGTLERAGASLASRRGVV